jgi:hypothetical protein
VILPEDLPTLQDDDVETVETVETVTATGSLD